MIFCSTTRSAGSNALPSSADHAASPAEYRAPFTDAGETRRHHRRNQGRRRQSAPCQAEQVMRDRRGRFAWRLVRLSHRPPRRPPAMAKGRERAPAEAASRDGAAREFACGKGGDDRRSGPAWLPPEGSANERTVSAQRHLSGAVPQSRREPDPVDRARPRALGASRPAQLSRGVDRRASFGRVRADRLPGDVHRRGGAAHPPHPARHRRRVAALPQPVHARRPHGPARPHDARPRDVRASAPARWCTTR